MLAAICVYYAMASELRGERIIHYTDNSGALACLLKDYSADLDSARLVHTFWALACAIEADVWFDFVKSEANVSDWPSRGHLAFADEIDAERVEPIRLPPVDRWGSVEAARGWAVACESAPGCSGDQPGGEDPHPTSKRRRR